MELSDGARGILMAHGTIGVGATLPRPESKEKPLSSRFVECGNGHGVIGQVWSATFKEWIGACPDCGDCPQGEPL